MYHIFLQGSIGDVNAILHERGCYSNDSRDLATLVVELKKKLAETRRSKALLDRQVQDAAGQRNEERKKITSLSVQVFFIISFSGSQNLKVKEMIMLSFYGPLYITSYINYIYMIYLPNIVDINFLFFEALFIVKRERIEIEIVKDLTKEILR